MEASSVISLDAMSGDLGAEVVVRAAKAALEEHDDIELVLVGDGARLEALVTTIVDKQLVAKQSSARSRLRIVHADEVVTMSDSPTEAVRKKKASSMRMAIDLVKSGEAQACVSAGNTGALMATAKFVLKMLPGIERPAILAELPAIGGSLYMLDLGANTQGSANQLFQFFENNYRPENRDVRASPC